jgi:prepilin-type N-terminal cleavage/methylation domain-containing protein
MGRAYMRKGFTLLELIVVIMIIGVLGSLGFTQYTRVVERGRSAEAKIILGQIRSAQEAYKLENGGYTTAMGDLAVETPTACISTHYFTYSVAVADIGIATRCINNNGKPPNGPAAYGVTLRYASGVWSGSTGYY